MPNKEDTLFQNYFSSYKAYDEFLKTDMSINTNWKKLLNKFSEIGYSNLQAKQNEVNWLMEENGVTYNVYNDPNGMHRSWNLNVVPFLIHENEWESTIEKGLIQRAELLNLVLKDIYGKRELIKNGILPQEVVFAHRGFLRQCDQIQYKATKTLQIYSADLARGPDGRMWVVSDRTQAPSGMGYALENRYALNNVVPDIFENINVKQPLGFFNDLKQMLIDSAPQNKDNPNIVVLTPGPHNETYFEHTYLASFLGYPLVMGSDLVVRNGKLWLKTLKKLKQVDVILRRVDDAFMDPLELREDSYLGVAGLLEVVREQQVAIVNPIGSGILENSGLVPFMNAICKYYFKEDLILPQIASWWCGQKKECDYVLSHLKDLVVKRIDRSNREKIFFCEFLDEAALKKLKHEILLAPYQFVAQEKISFSTAPNFVDESLEPRKVSCRTFAIAKKDSYSIMSGGLVRVAADREKLFVSNQRGGISKDFWVVSEQTQDPLQNYAWDASTNNGVADINDLSSNTAENLYWSGRYLGRSLVTARYLRVVLNRMNQEQFNSNKTNKESLHILYQSITNITSTFPGFIGKGSEELFKNPLQEIISLILDTDRVGSLAQTMNSFNNSYYSLRSLWSKDMWRVFDGIKKQWKTFKKAEDFSIAKLTKFLDRIITRLIAFMALIEESILVNQGLLLYFIGLQTEQATMQVEKCRALLVVNYEKQVQYEILEAFLNSSESLNIYRYSYRSYLSVENVIKLVLLDKEYAKSLTYQIKRIEKDVNRLPYSVGEDTVATCKEKIHKAYEMINSLHVEALSGLNENETLRQNLDDALAEISDLLHQTAMEVSNTYFNHSYTQKQLTNQNFPTL
ncbi:circularly permuted type 2 ATP-grasp protein [uncultured Algibacter sp.]|uniref:circularly permuted type 2 ATP-grasp protein n=1 Tax=uncultured Algibacter sp. TaxID=298659 RepID=UPI002608762A|nr:circularly permuted type 2 ATP-grasp protein [uncultured Algibacter sp.]